MDDYSNLKEELRPRLPEYVNMITTPDPKGGKGFFVCPLCGSGTHRGSRSTGAFHLTGSKWYCHSCYEGGDIFRLIELKQYGNIVRDRFPDIIKQACEIFRVPMTESARPDFDGKKKEVKKEMKKAPQIVKPDPELMKQIKSYASRIAGSPGEEYLHGRGFSDETISHFNLGFNSQENSVVIPYPGTDFTIERRLNPSDGKSKYKYPPGRKIPIFMVKEAENDTFFITEGQLDALSIYQAGARNVIAIGGGSDRLLDDIDLAEAVIVGDRDSEEKRTIVSPDQKNKLTPGEAHAQKFSKALSDRKIKSVIVYPPEGFKDSNDILKADPSQLSELLSQWKKELTEKELTEKELTEKELTEKEPSKEINVSDYLSGGGFSAEIEYFKKYKDRKFGFDNLDKYLTLYPGVACLGGASSLGKTTFAVNLVDNLLEKGESVMYFALEQLPIELVTKSLARRVLELNALSPIDNIDIKNGASSDDLVRAIKEYAETAKKYTIVKGDFHFTAKTIADYVEEYIKENEVKPIVVIDYLQLIAPPDGFKGTQREVIDENLKTIKDLSKRNELFILLISSFNRASYKEPVSMESFKESGLIEYTCDYIFGLQLSVLEDPYFYTGIGKYGGEKDKSNYQKENQLYEAINKNPKEVEFVCLKNRNGKQRFKKFFKYDMPFDTFTPDLNSPHDPEKKLKNKDCDPEKVGYDPMERYGY